MQGLVQECGDRCAGYEIQLFVSARLEMGLSHLQYLGDLFVADCNGGGLRIVWAAFGITV